MWPRRYSVFLGRGGYDRLSEENWMHRCGLWPHLQADEIHSFYNLTLQNATIPRRRTVRVRKLFIDQDGKAETSLSQIKKTGTQILYLMGRITDRKWGAGVKETRKIHQPLFSSKMPYGCSYYHPKILYAFLFVHFLFGMVHNICNEPWSSD